MIYSLAYPVSLLHITVMTVIGVAGLIGADRYRKQSAQSRSAQEQFDAMGPVKVRHERTTYGTMSIERAIALRGSKSWQ